MTRGSNRGAEGASGVHRDSNRRAEWASGVNRGSDIGDEGTYGGIGVTEEEQRL